VSSTREALERGAEHHRAGRWADAARAYADALREEPDNVDALALLGGAALRMGRPADALGVLLRAVTLAPEHALARLNQGRVLVALDRPAEAIDAFEAAIQARPGFVEARLGRARALGRVGRVGEAIDEARGVAAAGAVDGLALLGGLLVEAGRAAEAEGPLLRALASRPGDARILADLGAALLSVGREEEAAAVWRGVEGLPELLPRRAALARNLGLARLSLGSPDAVPWLAEAVRLDPADPAALLGLADALYQHPEPAPADALAALLAADGLDHQRIERAVRGVLASIPGLAEAVATGALPAPVADALTAHPLFTGWLTRTIVAAPGWARLLPALRRRVVARALAGDHAPIAVVEALALHGWHTEYADVDDAFDAAATPDAGAELPEGAPAVLRALTAPPAPGLSPALDALLDAVRAESIVSVPALGAVTDATSSVVRAQYEEHPYPRLVGVHRRTAGSFVAMARARLRDPDYVEPARILVAGGGTGQHPIGVAAGISGEVVCVDLSRASLARATRVAQRLGVQNLRFLHGDLLALGPDDGLGTFPFVDCIGTLHHLADPVAGGRALASKLAPAGILRLGLYSGRGRSEIVAARALIAEHGWLPTKDGLRAARRALLALPAHHPAAPVTASVDFYSQSGLRDLVFHPCEHRFSPTQVGGLLHTLGLVPVALQHARPDAERLYRARWPDDDGLDLSKWDALEAEHPRIFAGMIHVWARRPG